jgi:hypothetical protein
MPSDGERFGRDRTILCAYSDDVGWAFRLMSATCSDRSRPAVPIDVRRACRRARRGRQTAWWCRYACRHASSSRAGRASAATPAGCGRAPGSATTELALMPAAFAIIAAVRCVASPGGSPWVKARVRSRTLAGSGGMRERRVLSRSRPSTPARMNRYCQRHTVTLLVPAWRMISLVPTPSAVSKTICARHTCFCGLFRWATIASNRARSVADTSTAIPSRMHAHLPSARASLHPSRTLMLDLYH